jgi:membrane protein
VTVAAIGAALRDYSTRVWNHSRDDNIFFLASGIAFDILLATIPFVLLLITGLTYILNLSPSSSMAQVGDIIDRMLPPHAETADSPVHRAIADALGAHARVGVWSALTFLFLSTRLFTATRSVLAVVFDIKDHRGIIAGKLFDLRMTLIATLLFVANTILSAYLDIARSRGAELLTTLGLRKDVMGGLEYTAGRLLVFAFLTLMFFAVYRYMPARRVRGRTAAVAALFTSLLMELAKLVFVVFVHSFNPGSYYSGALAAIVVLVVWTYYAALIFILGGEVGHAYELRRARRVPHMEFSGRSGELRA